MLFAAAHALTSQPRTPHRFLNRPTEFPLNSSQEKIREEFRKRMETASSHPFYFFVTGPGGTGKSVLLKAMKADADDFFLSEEAGLIGAPTGGAAFNVGGQTLHSLFGISTNPNEIFQRLSSGTLGKLREKLGRLKVLIIDEISLLSCVGLALVSAHLQVIMASPLPFGGVSVVAFGDLYQLSPMSEPPVFEELPLMYRAARDLMAPSTTDRLWELFEAFFLDRVERNTDVEEVRALEEIRKGTISRETERFLKIWCLVEDWSVEKVVKEVMELRERNPGKLFTILSPRRKVVNVVNKHFLSEAEGRKKFPPLYTKDAGNDKARECQGYAEYLELAPECQVMLTINHDVAQGLVNGSVGKVEEISGDKIIVKFPRSRMEVSRVLYEKEKKMWRQFPLRMAEAMTIHAAQGKTYDGVIVLASFLDIGGLMYTALSRARSLKLCRITSLKLDQWKPPTGAEEEYENLRKRKHS